MNNGNPRDSGESARRKKMVKMDDTPQRKTEGEDESES